MTVQFKAQQRRDFLKAMAAVTGSLPLWAQAQSSWPSKPVTMVVPFPAGGGTDAFRPAHVGPICQADRQAAHH